MERIFILSLGILLRLSVGAQNHEGARLAQAAERITLDTVKYDPSYFSIPYPNGDIPKDRGVCTDVVIRAYRKIGVDLQQLVHEDMSDNFNSYPNNWGLTRTDPNIDHRRVPNLMTFFARQKAELNISMDAADHLPGDIICWDLGGGILHIGIVSATKVGGNERFYIVHNIGAGQVLEDVLFEYKIMGHYRFLGK